MLNEELKAVLLETVVSNCYSTKKGNSQFIAEVEETLNVIMNGIDFFNSLDEYCTTIDGVSMDDIKVLSDFVPFIYPAIISVDPTDYSAVNFISRDQNLSDQELSLTEKIAAKVSKIENFNIHKFMNAQGKYQGYFRRAANENLISLKEARKSVSLFDVIDRCVLSSSEYIHLSIGDKPYVPYYLNEHFNVALYKEGHYNVSVNKLLERFIREMYL